LFIVCEYVDPARLAPALYVFCAACDAVFAVFCAACDTVFAVFCVACDAVFAVFVTPFEAVLAVFFAFFRHFLKPPSEGVQGASRWNRAFGRSTAPSVVATPPENIAHVTASVSVSAIDARVESWRTLRARVSRDSRASGRERARESAARAREFRRRGVLRGMLRGMLAR
jgi:hypothetical protein